MYYKNIRVCLLPLVVGRKLDNLWFIIRLEQDWTFRKLEISQTEHSENMTFWNRLGIFWEFLILDLDFYIKHVEKNALFVLLSICYSSHTIKLFGSYDSRLLDRLLLMSVSVCPQSEQSSPFRRWTTGSGAGSSYRHHDHRNMYTKVYINHHHPHHLPARQPPQYRAYRLGWDVKEGSPNRTQYRPHSGEEGASGVYSIYLRPPPEKSWQHLPAPQQEKSKYINC